MWANVSHYSLSPNKPQDLGYFTHTLVKRLTIFTPIGLSAYFFLKTEATFTYLIVLEFICGPLFLHTLVFQKYYQKTEAIFTHSSLLSQSRGWLFLHSPVFYLYLFLYLKLYLFFWKKTWKTKVCKFRATLS